MIPLKLDYIEILNDLNKVGLYDARIEYLCNFSVGYLGQIRCGNISDAKYPYAARLYNLWCTECSTLADSVGHEH